MIIWKATEIELHPDNMNRQDRLSLSRSCGSRPLAEGMEECLLQEQDNHFLLNDTSLLGPSEEKGVGGQFVFPTSYTQGP
jgi:hypothetical protein